MIYFVLVAPLPNVHSTTNVFNDKTLCAIVLKEIEKWSLTFLRHVPVGDDLRKVFGMLTTCDDQKEGD